MMILASIANNIVCQVVTKKIYPQYICKGQLSDVDFQIVKKHVKGVFASKIGATLYGSVDNIVISSFFGLALLGKYTNYHYMITSLVAFFAIIHNTLRPILGNYIICENKDQNFKLFLQISSIYNWLSTFCTCCLICLFQDFIMIWAGEAYLFPNYYVLIFGLMFFVGRRICMPNLYSEAAGLWNESKWVYIIAAVTNLTLNISLALLIGLPGVPLATVASSLLVCAGGYIYVLFHYYFNGVSQMGLYIGNLLKGLIIQIVTIALIYIASSLYTANTISTLILKGIIVVVLFFICFVLLSFFDKKQMKSNINLVLSMIKNK